MTLIQKFWNSAKIGTQIRLGPFAVYLRLARSVRVSTNHQRGPLLNGSASISSSASLPETVGGSDMHAMHPDKSMVSPLQSGVALIVGTGPGLGSALARRFAQAGMAVAVAARNAEKLDGLIKEINALGGGGSTLRL